MRLIDADELKEVLHETIADEDRAKYWYDLIGVDEAINDAPTIDPVKHGRWKHEHLVSTGGGTYAVVRCSLCEWQYPTFETDFCPHCGARMDGGEE